MRTPRSPEAFAALVAVNVTPLSGIALLGWSPAAVLISYFVDTFLGFGALVLLVMLHVTGDEQVRPIAGWKNWAKAVIGLSMLGAIMALPLSFPLWMTIGEDPATWALFSDRGFLGALAVQCLMSALAVARMHRELMTRSDDDRVLARRAIFLAARWIAMFVAMVTGLVALLGPMIGGFILVAIYAGGSVYFDLFPERSEWFVRGKEAKPMTFEGELESQIASANLASPSTPQNGNSTTEAATKKS